MTDIKKILGENKKIVSVGTTDYVVEEISFTTLTELMDCFSVLKDVGKKSWPEIISEHKGIGVKFISTASGIPADVLNQAKLSQVLKVTDAVMEVNQDSFFLIKDMVQKWTGQKSSNTLSKKAINLAK